MSTRDYSVSDYGLLMTRDMLKIVASKVFKDYTEEDYDEDEWGFNEGLYEAGLIEYISDFTGESHPLTDDGALFWVENSEAYSGDAIFYVPISKYSTLFKQAYNNMDEVVEEFKAKLGKYLPKDFDYRSKIRHIGGIYYG